MPIFNVPDVDDEGVWSTTRLSGTALRSRERLSVQVLNSSEDVSLHVASEIAQLIRRKATEGVPCGLGLATGSTPMRVYQELVRMHKEEGLSFAGVTAFNLDEYYPMQPGALQSYHRFMHENLFGAIDIDPARVHIPDGAANPRDLPRICQEYEEAIQAAGGIDLQLLGMGRLGHIGFNERGSDITTVTRLVTLDPATRVDAASDFFGQENVPRKAVTMGVATILKARRIVVMAFGENKSSVVARAVEGPVSAQVPASFLQNHPNTRLFLDASAAAGLTRARCPWQLGDLHWSRDLVRQAVVWLAAQAQKPILRLTDDDYEEHGLQALVEDQGPVEDINRRIFQILQATITEWPGGGPGAGVLGLPNQARHAGAAESAHQEAESNQARHARAADSSHQEAEPNQARHARAAESAQKEAEPSGEANGQLPNGHVRAEEANGQLLASSDDEGHGLPEGVRRILILSPHPDDDVISMGGTFAQLAREGLEVHVAYQTSGNIAVRDSDVMRYMDVMVHAAEALGFGRSAQGEARALHRRVSEFLRRKAPGEVDSEDVQKMKTQIRYAEAASAATFCGASPDNLHFLNMPFYETGAVVKRPLSAVDVRIVVNLLDDVQPSQIYAAGDLSDPHGTHFTCLQAILKALEEVRERSWWPGCQVWLYRGAWQEWGAHEVDMAVPLSPPDVQRKTEAIWRHESQKDRAMFPGADAREFWERAQARNQATAQLYNQLGLSEFEAMEAFVRYDPDAPAAIFKPTREGA